MRLISAAALLLALSGQQPLPPDQPIRSSVDLVRVDVNAVDDHGRPIADLARDDFELHVDGRRRSIVTAQFVGVSADQRPRPYPGHYSSNADAAGGRLVMIAVDRTSITTGRARPALEAAARFLGRLNAADRVALATIPEGPQVNFTADHALVQQLILKIEGTAIASFGGRDIGIADALAFERRDELRMQLITERECGVPNVGGNQRGVDAETMICQGEVRSEALLVAADARARARQSLGSLQALLESFPPSETPKILAYISEGLVIQGEPSPLSWLDARAAAAHVTIYPLHLESSELDASRRKAPVSPVADRALQEHGLAMLAKATGGDLFRIISNSDFAFERLSAELSGYYLLGFEPEAHERDGRPHAIEVQVRRRGVTVRSRRQFTIPPVTVTTLESEIVATLRDPLPAAEIPLKLATYAFPDARQHQTMRLFLAAEVGGAVAPGSELAVGYVIVDFEGRLVTSRKDAALPVPATPARTQRYFSEVPVAPGKYTVKLAVVDDTGRRGSVERVAIVGMSKAGPVRATDLLLGDGPDPGWALPLAPVVSGEIAAGAPLQAYLELFADRAETFEEVSVTLEIAASGNSRVLRRVPVQLEPAAGNPLCRVAPVRVNVSGLSPGEYVARAVIAVGLDAVGDVSRPFSIVSSRAAR